jgi:glycine hydroxymethyltransferase
MPAMTAGATARTGAYKPDRGLRPPLSLAPPAIDDPPLSHPLDRPLSEADPPLSHPLDRPLSEVDPQIAAALGRELERQQRTLVMIASENFVPTAVLECDGSVLTNKYAVGYPGRRDYGGCEQLDVTERLAIDRACDLFGAEHANVQPYSGALANAAAYHALLEPGDTILALEVTHGGHLTHGQRVHVSGRLYDAVWYGVDRRTGLIDIAQVARVARERRPGLILAGWSAYPRTVDFEAFRAIADDVGAYLMVDMAHFAGLVAAGLYPNPVPYADLVTTTTHKTLGGPRGGMILCTTLLADRIDAAVYPGQQGGPLEHVIAGKAVALRIAGSDEFRERQERTVAGARAVANELLSAGHGIDVLTGGTDVHLVMSDLRASPLDGAQAEDRLAAIGITVSCHPVPFDQRPPEAPSGVRIGTAALATRGLQVEDFVEVGAIIAQALQPNRFERRWATLAERVSEIAERHPLYNRIGAPALV